ncbi:hypothetical protein CB1_000074008 [Camelus ferus]|nr:hypothetical protein CB1_000074008 [Camelus ferus]
MFCQRLHHRPPSAALAAWCLMRELGTALGPEPLPRPGSWAGAVLSLPAGRAEVAPVSVSVESPLKQFAAVTVAAEPDLLGIRCAQPPPPGPLLLTVHSLLASELRGTALHFLKNASPVVFSAPQPACPPPARSPPAWVAGPCMEPGGPPASLLVCMTQHRSLVLNRLRPAAVGGKAQTGSPRWRSKGYRCIGGVLYKVSANKLSKTCGRPSGDGGSRPLLRTGRLDPASSCSRSLASRAVQRSLAIVRQARQKRRKRKEYCMYYNRFGRCNRGERCPYIHDPEKVAVCTRFVRGTCKKTDGTCPFSHHVSKEKMPVCSYFLKGVCSNSSCPYSHVYVSRKAEVCTDFLKGYCPLGAKVCGAGGRLRGQRGPGLGAPGEAFSVPRASKGGMQHGPHTL